MDRMQGDDWKEWNEMNTKNNNRIKKYGKQIGCTTTWDGKEIQTGKKFGCFEGKGTFGWRG